MSKTKRSRHRRRWETAVVVAVAGGVVWLAWQLATPVPVAAPAASPAAFALPAQAAIAEAERERRPVAAVWPTGIPDTVGSATDLRRVFDALADSADPRQRRRAARAFGACVPAFLPGDGQTASPENLIAGLPAQQHALREAAYRELFARCHRLLAQSRSTLDDARLALERDTATISPGVRAQERLLAGETTDLEKLVGEVLTSGDATDVADLAGISSKLVQANASVQASQAALQQALETDAALALVSCDLGRDCGAHSLWALQLCAAEGTCEGDVESRLVLRNTQSGIDASAIGRRRSQLLDAIRNGTAQAMFRLPLLPAN